jgi:hypothetical protein
MALGEKALESTLLIEEVVHQLHKYLQSCDYAGYDPYDGLESRIFQALPFKRFRITRLAWIQLMKRSPLNLRPLVLVPQSRNPKGIALCAAALLKLGQGGKSDYEKEARVLLDWLITHQTRGYEGASWGYNFSWQSREFYAPKGTPNAICTIFVANAFLDAFGQLGDGRYLDIARKSCDFILEHLLLHLGDDEVCIRYVPGSKAQVHNVNLLGAALLARVGVLTHERHLLEIARKAVLFSVRRQNANGSWYYGELPTQRWIDNFHTGFNLVALSRYRRYMIDSSLDEVLQRGYVFWDQHFFMPDGAPKYYHNRLYPIDIHCAAQGILTYLEFAESDGQALTKAHQIAAWAIHNMRSVRGYFYYQKHRWYTIRIPYVRWSQAWMFYALSALLTHRSGNEYLDRHR